jgi:hypothetical protein
MSEIKNIKLNGTKLPLGGSGGVGGKVFEDVEQLPSTPDSNVIYRVGSAGGTVVPNTGYVDKVYLNTSLSIEEVVELVESSGITFFDISTEALSTEQGVYVVHTAVDSKGTSRNTMAVVYGAPFVEAMFGSPARLVIFAETHPKNENGDYIEEPSMFLVFASEDVPSMGVSAGWQGVDFIEIGDPLIDNQNGIPAGSENDKLTNLFSLTPNFADGTKYVNIVDGKKFEFVDKNSIAKIKDGTLFLDDKELKSNAVPNSGYVDNIYFNTDLSVEEVTAILDKIPDDAYGSFLEEPAYLLAFHIVSYSDPYCTRPLIITKSSEGRYQITYSSDTSNSDGILGIFNSSTGWNEDFNGIVDFNANALAFVEGYPTVGGYNDILTDLVYVKPKQEPISKIQYQGKNFVLSSFEDVKELPSSPNTGTIYRVKEKPKPVPNDGGIIEAIYFNTKLTIDEVVQIASNPNISWIDGSLLSYDDFYFYPICAFNGSSFSIFENDPVVGISLTKGKEGMSADGLISIVVTGFTTSFMLVPFTSENGWNTKYDSFSLNVNGMSDFMQMPIGTYNELITKLVSVTDFNKEAKYYNYDGTKLNNINTKEEYVIEFEYDKNKYSSESEFNDQVIKNYKLPDDLLSKFPDNINVRAKITYTNVEMYPVQTTVEEYELQDYWLFPKFGNGLRGAQLMFRYVNAVNKTSNTIRLARFAAEGEEVISNYFFYNQSLGSGGSSSTVDTTMSDSSTNPVQNKVIKEYVDNAIAGQSLTAGEGIKIVNGVISLTYANGDEEEF